MSSAQNSKSKGNDLDLLPRPRFLKILRGTFVLPKRNPLKAVQFICSNSAPNHPEGYTLKIAGDGITVLLREIGGLHAAEATLRQLLRQYGNRLPCLEVRDWPDFSRRGVMLDISRGRVPSLETLLEWVEHLADFKINELQLYVEHTFAHPRYKPVWQSWGALTAEEIRKLDRHCRGLGIDLVPNQNSFGHLRYFLEHPRLRKLAEVSSPYEDARGEFVRRPSTLAPNHPGTLPFLRGLYDELLPNFSSRLFNVGCDETWDLGKGQSKRLCERKGQGRVYLGFLKTIHKEVSRRGKTMMFWGDIILKYPKLIPELATFRSSRRQPAQFKQSGLASAAANLIALNWGYEANHPFEKETRLFCKSKIPFYVCPGTSLWQTMVGRHDNALMNLRAAAEAGRKYGAIGYLITDWGDGGHPQPITASYLPILAGASLAWNGQDFDERKLVPALSRDVFEDSTNRIARAAFELGLAHRKLKIRAANETPLGTVIAAPPREQRELFCRNGLNWYKTIPAKNITAALKEIEKQRTRLHAAGRPRLSVRGGLRTAPRTRAEISIRELDLAARMAAQSCKFMLWQQAAAAKRTRESERLARIGIRELQKLEEDFDAYWPLRNKATTEHCSAFLRWRINDYRQSLLRRG